jgi:Cytochrome c554 and c-prime
VKLPEQATRLGGVILVVVAAVLLLRFVVLPGSLFSAKPHQQAKVVREMALQVNYAGMTTCRSCHADEYDTKLKSYHRTVACENCHGPAAKHVANKDDKSAIPPKPRDREFCLGCHGYVSSRPNGFPQVDGTKHNPGKRCISCHDPHDPTPPETPKDCGGCHGRIARIKDVSTHAQLACTECHQVPPQHMTDPRSALPSKPQTRDTCARCHDSASTDAAAATIKRVDFKTHGRTFVCWECHYAHLPEGPKK